jgi:DtxR family Mn-dependent transcriptional regulator
MTMTEALSSSLEDYLEAIFHIVAEKGAARAKDISKRLRVNSSSVTGALRSLAAQGLVNYSPYDVVTLTSKGGAVAEGVVRRHEVLRDFLIKVLAVPPDLAEESACRMEHVVRGKVLERLIQFIEFIEVCPRGGSKWIRGFQHYCEHGRDYEHCERCLLLCLEELKEKASQKGGERAMTVSLGDLKPGQKGRIAKITGRGAANKRIVDMGVTPGTVVEVERVAPMGDPIEIKVKGYHLSLRKEEADGIKIEPL